MGYPADNTELLLEAFKSALYKRGLADARFEAPRDLRNPGAFQSLEIRPRHRVLQR